MRAALRRFFSMFWFQHLLGQRFKWYRRWYGGRWELHWIDICGSDIWLLMSSNPARQWPAYRQPCSFGTPLIEDWPARGIDSGAAGETRSGSTPKGQEPGHEGTRPNTMAHQENKHG